MRRTIAPLIASALILASMSGCQKFFTTSLASGLARQSISVPGDLSAEQAAELVAMATENEDTALASAIVSSLVSQISSMPDSAEKAKLQANAASAAVVASGTSSALTSLISSAAASEMPNDQQIIDMIATIKGGATSDVVKALAYLDPSTGLSAEEAKASGLDSTDLLVAAVIVASPALPADSNPTQMTAEEAAAFRASPEASSAIRIVEEASTMVEEGSASATLVDSLLEQFQLQSIY